jgi:lysophospholipase L1-like esterase
MKSLRTNFVAMKERNKRLVVFLISLFISLLIAEIIFRMNGKYASYNEITGMGSYTSPFAVGSEEPYHIVSPHTVHEQTGTEFTMRWTANNEGLNDSDFVVPKKGVRILALGDSFTEGVGATPDSTFPKQLSLLLKDSLAYATEVWNCGYSGSDPVYEFHLLKDKLLKYNPDMVVVTINSTDINEATVRGGFERFKCDGTVHYHKPPWFEPLYRKSYVTRRIVHDYFKYNWQFIRQTEEKHTEDMAVEQLITAIDSFKQLCETKNIKLLVVFHPFCYELTTGNNYRISPLIAYCENKQIPYADVRKRFFELGIDSSNASALYWKTDMHHNNKGYNYFVKSIGQQVVAMLPKN